MLCLNFISCPEPGQADAERVCAFLILCARVPESQAVLRLPAKGRTCCTNLPDRFGNSSKKRPQHMPRTFFIFPDYSADV